MDKKLQNLAKVGTINIVDDSGKLQTAQVSIMANELSDNVPVFQDYGITSNPRPKDANGQGAEALVLALNGNSSRRTIIKRDDRRYRPQNLASGDVALYSFKDTPTATHDAATHRIAFDTSGTYRTVSKCGSTTIEQSSAGTITLSASGDISISPGGTAIAGTNFRLPVHTAASLPSGTAGDVVFCSDGDSGSPCLAVYDGSVWKRVSLGLAI